MDIKTIDKLEETAIGGMKGLSRACKSVIEENKDLVHENEKLARENERLTSELGKAGKKLEEANDQVKRLEKRLRDITHIDRSRPRPPLNPPRTPSTTSPDSSDDEMEQAQKKNHTVSQPVASEQQSSVQARPGGSVPPSASRDHRPATDVSKPPPSTRYWSEQSTDAREEKKDGGNTLAKSQSFMSTSGGFGQSRRHQQTRGAQYQGNARGGQGFNSSSGQGSGQPQSRSQQGGGPMGVGRGRVSLKENNYRQQPTNDQQQWVSAAHR